MPALTAVALLVVVASAFSHAYWNLLAKRAGGGPLFVWLVAAASTILYAPLAAAVVWLQRPSVGRVQLLFMAGTACLHVGYFVALQLGYDRGDLSLVYPLARGTGPLLSVAGAVALLGERPTPVALAGTLLVGAGVLGLSAGVTTRDERAATLFGLLTGLSIACYTLWDKQAVTAGGIPPLLLTWSSDAGRSLLLLPAAFNKRHAVAAVLRSAGREVAGVALLAPLSYILVLVALRSTPVSYVAPVREIGVLIGAALGVRVLAEGNARRRLAAAGAIVAGVVALALG
jgi:drug/metabolite transporter (DMT)-like permease